MNTTSPRALRTAGGIILAACSLVLSLGGPPAADAAAPDPGTRAERSAGRYIYTATFKGGVKHHVQLQYYDERDGEVLDASAAFSGKIRKVTMVSTGSSDPFLIWNPGVATLKALSGEVDSTTTTDSGRTEVRCEGDSIWRTDKEHPFPDLTTRLDLQLVAFARLTLPQTCQDNQGGPPIQSVHSLPGIGADLHLSRGKPGGKRLTYTFVGRREFPRTGSDDDAQCPGESASLTVACTYVVRGTMDLTLVRRTR